MHIRELAIKNYEAFLPHLRILPLTHRYWKHLYEKHINSLNATLPIDDDTKQLIIAQVKLAVQRAKDMTDTEFIDGKCGKKLCYVFHNTQVPFIKAEYLFGNLRIITIPIEDNFEGDTQQRVEELIDGKWIDRGELIS